MKLLFLEQSASLLGKKLQGKSGSTFQELLDLLTVCQDLMTPLLSHELVKKETELLLKEPVLKNPFIETPTTSLSILQPIIESFEKSKVILVEKCWIFIENGFSLTGKSLHALLDLQLACRIISALHKE